MTAARCTEMLQHVVVCCEVLQCVGPPPALCSFVTAARCHTMLQCVAVRCSDCGVATMSQCRRQRCEDFTKSRVIFRKEPSFCGALWTKSSQPENLSLGRRLLKSIAFGVSFLQSQIPIDFLGL